MKPIVISNFDPNALASSRAEDPAEAWLAVVAQKVKRIEYGTVQIVIHDGRVVYVESNERHRFDVKQGA